MLTTVVPARRAILAVVSVVVVALLAAGCGHGVEISEGSADLTTLPPPPPPSTTTTTVPTCPQPTPPASEDLTELATPATANIAYSATPGGPSVGHVTEHWGGPSTRPVLQTQGAWVLIPLESRPNGSTGWVPDQAVTMNQTAYLIVVSVCNRSLTLFQSGTAVYSAPVGVGQPQWPTPQGPTFIDSVVATPRFQQYIYGPTVFILGTHSKVFTDFDGGDGTVAIHGYPSDPPSTNGVASSHGCIRSSPTTINTLKGTIPVGTPVNVVA